jgi:hypothetical protein
MQTMRGPLLSGAVGSAVTLRGLSQMVRAHPPVVVIRSPWLGLTLSSEATVVGLLPREALGAARRRRRRKNAGGGPGSLFALAGAALPLAPGCAGSLVVPDLAEVPPAELVPLLLQLAEVVRPDGLFVGVDRTKDPAVEARLAGALLAAGYSGIVQGRPREGALLTQGHPPPAIVRQVLAESAPVATS